MTVWCRLLDCLSRRASGRSVMDCLVEGVPTYGDLASGGRFFWDVLGCKPHTETAKTFASCMTKLTKHLETLLGTDILEGKHSPLTFFVERYDQLQKESVSHDHDLEIFNLVAVKNISC